MNSPARRVALASLALIALVVAAVPAPAQVSLSTLGVAYTQSFDTLPASGSATWTNNTTISGWYHARTGTGTTIVANDGASNAGNLYSYGTGTNAERALGSLGSGNAAVGNLFWGVRLQNNTGSTITSLVISYTGEQWRNSAATANTVAFSYLVGSPSVTGTLVEFQSAGTVVTSLDFTSPITGGTAGALNGNLAANRIALSFTITGLSISNGTEVMLRWSDPDNAGSDHGLSIDDFSVTPQGVPADTTPSVVSTVPTAGATGVATNTNITVTFTEPVTAGVSSFALECPTASAQAFTVSGSGTATVTIDPTADLPAGTSCDVRVIAANVTDLDGTADPMASNYAWTFQTASAGPTLSVNDVSAIETNAGTTTFSFTVSLSAPAGVGGVTFDIATADNTATTANNDYVLNSLNGQTIAAGNSTYTFNVTVNGDTTLEPDETFFVNVTNVTGATVLDGQGQGTIQNDDYTPIHTIQGNGLTSPFDGIIVTTAGIVTALKFNNGFFIQEPDATIDADPATSEGLFVYTGAAPTVAVGDFVRVAGTVDEFNQGGQYGVLTELVGPLTITPVSSGNTLPAPIVITAAMSSTAGPWEQFEHLEGMRVSVAGFTVTAATDGNPGGNYTTGTSFGDCYGVVPGVARPFREDGIAFPRNAPSGTSIPPLLRFDSNPETLRVDTDGQVGVTRQNFSARTVLPGFTGVLDYAFSRYSILPDAGSLPIGPAEFGPAAVTAPLPTEFTVASYNLQRFFDDVNDPAISEPVLTNAQYTARLAKASVGIRNFMRTPDVVGVVEMENLATLQALATRINNDAVAAAQPDPLYQAYLIEGNDVGGIDVGFLVKTSLAGANPRVEVVSVTQELDGTLFTNPDSSTETLNDRPPLMLAAVIHGANGGTFPVTVLVNHLRSLNDVDNDAAGSNGWTTIGDRVRAKRHAQAVDLANFVQARQTSFPGERIILVGDFNSFDVNDSLGHLVATIAGTPVVDATTAVPGDGVDLVTPDLVNLGPLGAVAERYSYVYDFTAQMIDQALVNAALVSGSLARRVEFARINADFPEIDRPDLTVRLSDHDPLVVFVQAPAFATAGLSTALADAPDPVYPGAGLAYTITVTNGGPDTATGLTLTDTLPAGTVFASLASPGGWSCTTPAVGATGAVSCTAATLAAASNAVFTLTVTVDAGLTGGTILSNTASVTQTSVEGTPGDESATETTTVQTPPAVYATKSASSPVATGGPLTYTIVLSNNGTTAQLDNPGDELVDVLPASLTLVSASATSGTAVATVATNTVTWNGSVPAGGSVTLTILAQVSGTLEIGDSISNQATVSYDADGNGTNETSVSSDDPGTGTVGDPTTVTVSLGVGGLAVVPALDGVGLGLLAALVALGGAFLVGRRLS